MFRKFAVTNSAAPTTRRRSRSRLALLSLLVSAIISGLVGEALPAQAVPFSSPFFRREWQRADYPVVIGAAQRGFTWGPEPFVSTFEPYGESPNGQRRVEYFDKARMEISRPDYDSENEYYVTNGLIVREMVLGGLQVGEFSFKQRMPAYDVPVAGDPAGNNRDAVTYASFFALSGAQLLNRAPDRINERAYETISKGGTVGRNELLGALDGLEYTFYERTLGHNIPRVFYNYLTQSGQVYDGRNLFFGPVFNWVETFGYPLTDAYWTKTVVAGVTRDVLVQLFERRVLTYTPTNPEQYRVEMGNVGRHYYNWRYSSRYDLSIPIQSNAEVRPEAGFPGVVIFVKIFNFIENEDISQTLLTPDGKPFVGRIIPGQFENPTGFTFFGLYYETTANTPPGLYTVYYKGLRSGNEAKAYFFVLGIPGYNLPLR